MDNLKFGKFIAEERKSNGLTQTELAEKLNVTDKTVSKWECGRGFPDIKLIEALADNLGVSVAEIMQCEKNQYNEEVNLSKPISSSSEQEGVKWFRKSLRDNLVYILKHFDIYGKRMLLVALGSFCLVGTLLAPYSSTGIFEYIWEFGYNNGFMLYELGIGIIIWQVFVNGNVIVVLENPRKSKKITAYMLAFSYIVNIFVLIKITQLFIVLFNKAVDGEMYNGMLPAEMGPYIMKMINLTRIVLGGLCGFCILCGKRYSNYLTISTMQHISGIYALLTMECMMKSLDLSGTGGSYVAQLMIDISVTAYIKGIVIMVAMMLLLKVKGNKAKNRIAN